MSQVAEMAHEGLDSTLYRDDEVGLEMGEQEYPDTDHILAHWWTTSVAAKELNIHEGHVRRLCGEGVLKSRQIAGSWYIDPAEKYNYQRYQHRDKSDTE